MKRKQKAALRMLCAAVAVCCASCLLLVGCNKAEDTPTDATTTSSSSTSTTSSTTTTETTETTTTTTASSATTTSQTGSTKKTTKATTNVTTRKPVQDTSTNGNFIGYKYNVSLNIENNVFLDALEYTGYNLKKHRADGMMWKYVLSNDKKWRGWLSGITYGGGSLGIETTADGKPDLNAFKRGGLVCASFASYVYFNYLPNVAGIDTSSLDLPDHTPSAQSFYYAAQKWLKKGYTYNIDFTAKNTAYGIVFNPKEEIPIGSIICFRNIDEPGKTYADHITVYVGKKNGYHWVIQTGNKNGPEFCAVERFKFGPGPQWPLKIFATPTCINDALGEKLGAPLTNPTTTAMTMTEITAAASSATTTTTTAATTTTTATE